MRKWLRKFCYTIYDTDPQSPTFDQAYMTRLRLGRPMIHIFYRCDYDDPHDHPYGFWTFPLRSYVEEVFEPIENSRKMRSYRRIVRAFRWHYRPAEHIHRIRGRYSGNVWGVHTMCMFPVPDTLADLINNTPSWEPYYDEIGTFVTLVWRGPETREWGFWKLRDLKWCWQRGRDYYTGGKRDLCD